MEKFICIHGHFYQPPRENPWLEEVELQDSAAPYHDWNERISAECYAPNTAARILDGDGRIERIVNNFSRISFNFGPTLLAWMQHRMPDTHEAIIEADRLSREHFSGHGSALAQAYNHIILPLANERDRHTQIVWGIRDFEFRFGRRPEGLWLAETAADGACLEMLAEHGIRFTILSPFQASRMRELGSRAWRDVNGGRIDPTRPYLVRFPSGRSLTVFFYDGPVSQAVAFEGLLNSGERFAHRLLSAFSDRRHRDQLVHIATDGESYGHHHAYGEMALAYALQYIERNRLARLTNYGEFLEHHPPTHEVQIHEPSAWSCSHGVRRWKENCGCNSGGHPGWQQHWRDPLRQAFDWLRDALALAYEAGMRQLGFADPWAARNDYIDVILDRHPEFVNQFFAKHLPAPLAGADRVTCFKLLELQRHAMLMYTSCGWFFDELSGIETVQVIQYAARSLQLADELFAQDFESDFLERLSRARSNIPEHGDGRILFEKFVRPAVVDWAKVVAHYAISSLFEKFSDRTKVFLYHFSEDQRQERSAGRARLTTGRTRVEHEITSESALMTYAILYLGEHQLTGGVKPFTSDEHFLQIQRELSEAFERADFPETIRLLDRHFGEPMFSLKSLFKDQQRKILHEILVTTQEDLESRYRRITEQYLPLMKFLTNLGAPLPAALQTAADFVLQIDILRQFQSSTTDLVKLHQLLEEARTSQVDLSENDELALAVKGKFAAWMEQFASAHEDLKCLDDLVTLAGLVRKLPMDLNLWKVQNLYYRLLNRVLVSMKERARCGDAEAQLWLKQFFALGEHLGFSMAKWKS
ncbi:MAG: DUF3536 domain-containing protein [Verrucomicrobiota bacterium]